MAMNETVVEPVAIEDAGTDVSPEAAGTIDIEEAAPDSALNEEARDEASEPADRAAIDADADVTGDGRQIPPALRSALNDLRLTDPKLANRLKNVWFADLALRKEFPGGLNEARALREFKERFGGEEGIQRIEQERQYFQDLDQQLVAGDAKVLEHLASVAPEGFAKLVPPAMAKLAETSPEHFEHLAGVMIAGNLPGGLMEAIHQVLAGHEETAGLAQHLANWYNPLVQTLHSVPQRRVEPERQRLEADRQQFEAGKTAEFQRGIVKEIELDGGAQADKIIDQLSSNKLSSEAKFRLKGVITSELDAALRADAAFLQKRDRLLAEGNRNKILTNYKAEISKRLPEIVKKVHREFYGATRPVAKAPVDIGTGRAAQTGRQPDSSAIDWSRTSRRDVLDGKAYVKGRAEQVRW